MQEKNSRCSLKISRNRLDLHLSRRQRLIRTSEFKEIYAGNKRLHGKFMVFWYDKRKSPCLRVGVVASKKIGNAVERNRAKRRLREVFRLNRHNFQNNVDVVLVARPAILKAKWEDIEAELRALASRAELLNVNDWPLSQ